MKRPVRARHLGEVVLAHGTSETGEEVLATPLALYVPDRDLRVAWDRVSSATWEDPMLRLVTTGEHETYTVELEEAGLLPEVIRERVQASILVSEYVQLRDDARARFSARREPAGDSEVRWTVTFDPGLDPEDQELRWLAARALERLRQTFGV